MLRIGRIIPFVRNITGKNRQEFFLQEIGLAYADLCKIRAVFGIKPMAKSISQNKTKKQDKVVRMIVDSGKDILKQTVSRL